MTLLYLNAWRRSSAELIKHTLAATGQLPDYEFVAAALPDATARDLDAAVPLSIRGPALVHVGRGARFRALQGGAAVQVEWAVDPAEGGQAEPSAGERTTVTPTRLGPLTVRATAGDADRRGPRRRRRRPAPDGPRPACRRRLRRDHDRDHRVDARGRRDGIRNPRRRRPRSSRGSGRGLLLRGCAGSASSILGRRGFECRCRRRGRGSGLTL